MSTQEIKNNISLIFKSARYCRGLQQTEMARILAVTQGTISKIEAASMSCDLSLWMRFTRIFNVKDAYCFEYGAVEFEDFNFISLENKLAPSFTHSGKLIIFEIRRIRPLYEYLKNNYYKDFKIFLKDNKIREEVFYILNHPVSAEFADVFFNFLVKMKMNKRTLQMIELDYGATYGDGLRELLELSSGDVIKKLNLENSFLSYKPAQDSYVAEIKKNNKDTIENLDNSELIIYYNVIYPYRFLKRNKKEFSVEKDSNGWKVLSVA